jgi:hypothetical protein
MGFEQGRDLRPEQLVPAQKPIGPDTLAAIGSLTADWERFFEVRAGLAFNASSAKTSRAGCRRR